jgi:predicted DNA repair protein MutK
MLYVFPSSYMLGAASGIIDSFFYQMAAVAILVNTALYSVVGFVVGLVLRLLVKICGNTGR